MNRIIFTITFSIISFVVFSQSKYYTITGKVINSMDKSPMQGASVFAENTTLGTLTDANGNFEFQLPNGGYSVAVSFTGFNTEIQRVSNIGISQSDNRTIELNYELTAKEKMMQDVSIVSTGEVKNGWEKYGSFFLEEFIGKTPNSLQCTIQNPEVLKFYFSKKKNRLKVLASEALKINNQALGYSIRYELDSFIHEYNTEISIYTGYPLYEEMKADSDSQQKAWVNARLNAYYGSILHFMRSLYDQQLVENGFEIQFLVTKNNREEAIKIEDYYKQLKYQFNDSNQIATIQPDEINVGVIYKEEKPAQEYLKDNKTAPNQFQFSSILFPVNTTISIEQNGFYFDQSALTFNDYWEWTKMADALPYDYIPEETEGK